MPPKLRAASVLPVPILTRFHLCGRVDHRLRSAALPLKCTFILIIDFKIPLLPLSGSTGQGIWVGGVSTVLRGRGQIHPEVICCKQEGSRTQACPHTLSYPCTRKTHFGTITQPWSYQPFQVARNHSNTLFSF